MALINFLKFSTDRGAIISDEEYWNVFFRKRMHGDNLHSLLDPATAKSWGMQIVYGAAGYPSVHKEAIQASREMISRIDGSVTRPPLTRVKEVARIAFENLQAAIRRRVDQKLEFFYGFKTEDLNCGKFAFEDQEIPIANPEIKTKARKIANLEVKDTLLKFASDSKAAVFGFDSEGITGYHLSLENSILGYVHEGFEAIGSGKYASGLIFGQDFKAKTLKMRQAGYDTADGLFELIHSATLAGDHFKEVGGNYNIVLLDRSQTDTKLQYREIFDNTARLAAEIVKACRFDLIDRNMAINLIDRLIVKSEPFSSVENALLTGAKDPVELTFILRNYKRNEASEIAHISSPTIRSNKTKKER